MPIGTTAATCYEGEDLAWSFTVTDPNVATISGWTIELVVGTVPRPRSGETGSILVGPVACTVTDTLVCLAEFNADLTPGTYRYSLRRVDSGFEWQLAQAALTVLDSASR